MLAKIMDEDPPLLPSGKGFSMDFRSFVSHWYVVDCWLQFCMYIVSAYEVVSQILLLFLWPY